MIETRIPFRNGETYVQIAGDLSTGIPLVILHGGPGSGPSYLEPLLDSLCGERPVVYYDQVSVRNTSDIREDGGWPISLFVEQYLSVLNGLNIDKPDLLGHSWGGFLAQEIALANPESINRLILSNTLPSGQSYVDGAYPLMLQMPEPLVKIIVDCESTKDYDNPHYKTAIDQYYQKHLCRVIPLPEVVVRSRAESNNEMYLKMWGPSEFTATGTLKDWNVESRLPEIEHQTLVISGDLDMATPEKQQLFVNGLPNMKWELFEGCSHHCHLEDPEHYQAVINAFLD